MGNVIDINLAARRLEARRQQFEMEDRLPPLWSWAISPDDPEIMAKLDALESFISGFGLSRQQLGEILAGVLALQCTHGIAPGDVATFWLNAADVDPDDSLSVRDVAAKVLAEWGVD
jgi:hypothetical protein